MRQVAHQAKSRQSRDPASRSANNNMADLDNLSVPKLRGYLQERCVTVSDYKKCDLLRLAKRASDLELDVVEADDHELSMKKHRKLDGGEMPPLADLRVHADLSSLPHMDLVHVFVYLTETCGWDNDKLRKYQKDNAYLLFKDRHISDVRISDFIPVGSKQYLYTTTGCRPQTRQSAPPYSTWLLISNESSVQSGGCSCVAG